MFTANSARTWRLWAAIAVLFFAGCSGSGQIDRLDSGDSVSPVPAASGLHGLVPAVAELRRLTADDGGSFKPQRPGSEFAEGLSLNRCTATGDSALFDPVWQAGMPNMLDDAAFCLYRLRLYRSLEEPVTLTLEWEGYAPPAGACWLGLPNWDQLCWQWQVLPEYNEVTLADPALYANIQDECYAAVVLLDEFPRQLTSIGFGDLEPPVPPAQYNLFDPMFDHTTYLVDMEGNLVHSWATTRVPATCSYLLENGHLLRPGHVPDSLFEGSGGGGTVEEFDWDGSMVWSFNHSTSTQLMHHDIEPMPNGNILAIVWEVKTREELEQAGRIPNLIPFVNHMKVDAIFEIEPLPEGGGEVVWEWHLWDHIIQDHDAEKDNYGVVIEHPELVDINFIRTRTDDYSHFNGVAYNAELDQIAVTASTLSEIWIIDHSTTTEEAASHEGGNGGRGGDLLYRWGNPAAYDIGVLDDKSLFGGHNVHWIPEGCPGAGNLMVFNNGGGRPDGNYSSIDELVTPLQPDGTYYMETGQPYGPADPAWSYVANPPATFYSWYISGAHRLPNGNTVVCSGATGWFFEVTPGGEVVWEYTNPYTLLGGYAVFRMTRLFGDYPGLSNLPPEDK